ncbi:MAG: hypothetical protein WDO74_03675 [Pseudomonadota bacterium]
MSSALASPSGIAVRGRSLTGFALLALLLPLFLVRPAASAYADAVGDRIAAWLIAVVPTPLQPLEEAGSPEVEPPFGSAASVRGAAVDAKRPRPPSHARAAPRQGIRISSAQVLALAARRAMPNAVFVKANTQRPAGLLLSGVSGLGVGLQDGDVLTEAAGQKVSSVAAVVGLVLAARARQASEISGRFYRGGVPFSLTVEQPYPKDRVPG